MSWLDAWRTTSTSLRPRPRSDPHVYQHLTDYWADIQRRCPPGLPKTAGRPSPTALETKKNKDGTPGKTVDKGWPADLVPATWCNTFAAEQAELDKLTAELTAG